MSPRHRPVVGLGDHPRGILAVLLPPRWALFTMPGDGWRDAHLRWAVVLGVALTVLALTLRDPARRRIVSYPGLPPTERNRDDAAAPGP